MLSYQIEEKPCSQTVCRKSSASAVLTHVCPHVSSAQESSVWWSTMKSTSSRCPAPTPAPSSPCPGWNWAEKCPSAVPRAATPPPSPSTPNLSMGAKFTGGRHCCRGGEARSVKAARDSNLQPYFGHFCLCSERTRLISLLIVVYLYTDSKYFTITNDVLVVSSLVLFSTATQLESTFHT